MENLKSTQDRQAGQATHAANKSQQKSKSLNQVTW